MTNSLRKIAIAAAIVPLALGLGACKQQGSDADASLSGQPIAKIAPPAGKTWVETIEVTPDGGYRMGNPEAPIKLVEYGSLSCPHCAKLSQDGSAELQSTFVESGRVSWEFRSFAIHPQDVPLTVLAQCAPKEAYFPLVDQLYANFEAMNAPLMDKAVQERANAALQQAPDKRFSALADALGYTQFFAQRGVSADQARACLSDQAAAKKVADAAAKYGADGIESTPTVVLNGRKLDINTWAPLKAELERLGAR